ncbi:MAG: ribosome biogenesis GTPase Der [Polyangiaceae bacterium]
MRPIVAIIGRPNVGKSTLFNRFVGKRLAIVHDEPGVTRDRHYADAHIAGRDVVVVDTGGFDPDSDDPMRMGIARHVQAAIAEADVVLCVLDTTASVPADQQAVDLLRRSDKPVLYLANKADTAELEAASSTLYELGVPELFAVSGLHGRGLADVEVALGKVLPPPEPAPAPRDDGLTRVALLGRPNAGKSSLFNRLSGGEKSLVDSRPGTTRDPIDSLVEHGGRRFVLVDTAGVRRRSKVDEGVEAASVLRAIRSIERAEVVVLLVDASEGIAEQDARLLGLCVDRMRAVIIGMNKMDELTPKQQKEVLADARHATRFAGFAPVLGLSAKTGKGVGALVEHVARAAEQFKKRVPTAELNRFFEQVLAERPPPTRGGRAPRIYYVTQVQTSPPVFAAMSNAPANIDKSYKRFVTNQLRKAFGFEAVPLLVHYRKKKRDA